MGDELATRSKEFSPPMIQCSTKNYMVWSMRMKILLKIYKVLDMIEPGTDDFDINNIAI